MHKAVVVADVIVAESRTTTAYSDMHTAAVVTLYEAIAYELSNRLPVREIVHVSDEHVVDTVHANRGAWS